ncbi:MAG: glycosyl transferase [Hyphomicrobiales bacterium]|nr:MAG: glycosyl transferase [Hyphomicrobiales bacterium]
MLYGVLILALVYVSLQTALAPLLILLSAAAISALLCVLLRPLLVRYALARPNARSSHRVPTPQGGGIAVLAGAFLAIGLVLQGLPPLPGADSLAFVVTVSVVLAVVGAWDDIRPLSAGLRLCLQALCVAVVIVYAAPNVRLFPELMPLAVERCLALLAGMWFVNLTNFMDGIDWITIAGIVPLAGALALAGATGLIDPASGLLAAALCGGLLGFAPFNKPTARLFLGDVGSLPIGLLSAYLLYRLAGTGALAAALILPLYHVADATITLLRRLLRREKIWEAHRSHFYQQATTNGHGVLSVVTLVSLLNCALVGLATLSILMPATMVQLACIAAAIALTALVLRRFSRQAPAS